MLVNISYSAVFKNSYFQQQELYSWEDRRINSRDKIKIWEIQGYTSVLQCRYYTTLKSYMHICIMNPCARSIVDKLYKVVTDSLLVYSSRISQNVGTENNKLHSCFLINISKKHISPLTLHCPPSTPLPPQPPFSFFLISIQALWKALHPYSQVTD